MTYTTQPSPAADTTMFDISADADLEVELVDLPESNKDVLKRGANHHFHSFVPADTRWIPSGRKEASSDQKALELQRLFYRSLLENVSDGMNLHAPCRGTQVPDSFNLDSKLAKQELLARAANEDAISISPSVGSLQDERQQGGNGHPFSRPADTLSIGSGISTSFSQTFSHAAMIGGGGAGDDSQSDSNADAEEEMEPESIYEDINDICENIEAEIAATPTPKDVPNKKASFLSFLKSRKNKGKKEKEKDDVPLAVSSKAPSVRPERPREVEETKKTKPDLIPTYSSSTSEEEEEGEEGEEGEGEKREDEKEEDDEGELSYDEMKPGNEGYLSDNYEDVGFDQPPPLPAPIRDADFPPTNPAPSIKDKAKFLRKGPALEAAFDKDAKAAGKKDGLSPGKFATLPRKMKLSSKPADKRSESFNRKTNPAAPIVAKGLSRRPSFGSAASEVGSKVDMTPEELNREVVALRREVEELKGKLTKLCSTVELLTSAQNRKQDERSAGMGNPRARK